MKPNFQAALAALPLCMAFGAAAQSSVELYGVLDVGVQRSNNGVTHLNSESSNGNALASRLGFRGTEDLGDGLKAQFVLENGLTPDTGAQADAARFFNRRSTVALLGGWGEVRLGRDYTPTYWQLLTFDPFGTNGVAKVITFDPALSNQATAVRADNSVQYRLPGNLGGLQGEVMVSANESTTGPTGNKYAGGRLGYVAGPVNVALAYGQTTVTPLLNGSKVKELFVGGSYDFGLAKLSLNLADRKLGDNRRKFYQVGAVAPVSAAGAVKFSFVKYKNNSAASDDATLIGLGYTHNLSRRTQLYATAARIKNDPAAAFAAGSLAAVAGKSSTGYEAGLRHSF
jgi:predicted porin